MAASLALCCDEIKTNLDTQVDRVLANVITQLETEYGPIKYIGLSQGGIVMAGNLSFATMGQYLNRLGGFDGGFGWWVIQQNGKPLMKTFNVPGITQMVRVTLNGSTLAKPRDYSIAGTTLTLSYNLAVDDVLTIKSFGV